MRTAELAELESDCPKWKFLSTTTIKLIAVIFMFMDHIHQMFVTVGAPVWLTMIGRLAFPMFLFTAAESFHYTRNKIFATSTFCKLGNDSFHIFFRTTYTK